MSSSTKAGTKPLRFSPTRFFVTLEGFAGFLCIKAVWGIEEKLGYELATVLNSTFCYKLHPLELCSLATNGTQERTPDGEPPAVLWLIIWCKGNHSISIKQIYSYIFLPSLLSVSAITVASYMAPDRKVRIRLRPINETKVGTHVIYVILPLAPTACPFRMTPSHRLSLSLVLLLE